MIGDKIKVEVANPNHPVTQEMEGNYSKLLASVMLKLAPGKTIVLNEQDVAKIAGRAIVVHAKRETLELSIVTLEEMEAIVRREGGKAV